MANFQTHFGVGTAVVGVAALATHAEGLSDLAQTQWLFVLGLGASVFPDIDADESRPVRVFFGLLGLIAGFVIATLLWQRFAIVDLTLIWAGIWLLVYFVVRLAFARLTVHRGVFHSLLMAAVASVATASAANHWLQILPDMSWLAGAFVLLGYVTHLALDEIVSVDVLGNRVKRSFGTALKPFSLRNWPGSLFLVLVLVGLSVIAPDPDPAIQMLASIGISAEFPVRISLWWQSLLGE